MQKKVYSNDDEIRAFLTDAETWKRRADDVAALFGCCSQLRHRGEKITTCGTLITFAGDQSGAQLVGANFCRQRLCPVCQWRRSRMVFANLTDVWHRLEADGYDMIHLVLTRKNVYPDRLSDEITSIFKAFSKLIKIKPTFSGWKGCLRFLEVTYNPQYKTYHPHLHVLIAVRPSYWTSRYYVTIDAVRTLWAVVGHLDYEPMVYVRRADPRGVLEVSKYCVKPMELKGIDPSEELRIYQSLDLVLHGRRMIQSYGVIRDVIRELKFSDSLDDTPESEQDYSLEALKRIGDGWIKTYKWTPHGYVG